MPDTTNLIVVIEDARRLLDAPGVDFAWSSWDDAADAVGEIDGILARLHACEAVDEGRLRALFAPTGPIQEAALGGGRGETFLELADRFDDAMAAFAARGNASTPGGDCACLSVPPEATATVRELGMDEHFADVTVVRCLACGRNWLRYFYEVESFSRSGRWYLGALTAEAPAADATAALNAERAKGTLERLDWYYYGGSYFDGRVGRASGPINLNP